MPVFELYNADGSLQFDMAGRVPRILGSLVISGAGSLINEGLRTGEMFYTLNLTDAGLTTGVPSVTAVGNTLSWGAPTQPMFLTYMVY
ncbi:hypothetical protein AUC61_14720 [Pseudomonas sp. S25]|uniref:Uncharacterized protein n=1 Tax=Pseudomonas maioricensis TaxID=1766623 RepID=A0ABS9ZPK0_9PSED|nr:hypothetical protein [Pseudomonas sp. S25]